MSEKAMSYEEYCALTGLTPSKSPMIRPSDAATALQLLYCLPEEERATVARAWLIDLGAPRNESK